MQSNIESEGLAETPRLLFVLLLLDHPMRNNLA